MPIMHNSAFEHEKITTTSSRPGQVWLVGAGPGDPDLITVKALNVLRAADVVIYDRLIAGDLLNYCPPQSIKLYVGKQRSRHSVPQSQINQLLVEYAQSGKKVVRLKGGDPFIFGRGGEEMMALRAHGVQVDIVPGITAASGCAAATGIPLTHRDHAGAVSLMTAHRCDGATDCDWASLTADRQRTLVFYMGLAQAQHISTELILHGLPGNTPAALISKGSTTQQKAVSCTVETLAKAATQEGLTSPCLIMVGSVVQLADPARITPASLTHLEQATAVCPE
ncbi:uroporphyrinogen-III C-methyltransferase [Neopusillimonas maritima]|uniref:uroporphyrinogen-III C-methyltransferase n=2 Tax=Neopusillimonas maritima TaxID=2026239 RepID=A0A3A1YVA0_9BURK|nr:uroporphyrinogen-III C-methyltransferase [Neopusillimonas maritima]